MIVVGNAFTPNDFAMAPLSSLKEMKDALCDFRYARIAFVSPELLITPMTLYDLEICSMFDNSRLHTGHQDAKK